MEAAAPGEPSASTAALVLTVVTAGACGGGDDEPDRADDDPDRGHDSRAPGAARQACTSSRCETAARVDMRVTRPGKRPYALIVALHGAGGSPDSAIEAFGGAWDVPGLVFVAPAAKGPTWSVISSDRDLDLESVDFAVAEVWARCPLAHDRLALGGFSDGATYALTLGVANGDLFPAIIALSPGGILADTRRGQPRIFVSHGTEDDVLPIAGAERLDRSRAAARRLRGRVPRGSAAATKCRLPPRPRPSGGFSTGSTSAASADRTSLQLSPGARARRARSRLQHATLSDSAAPGSRDRRRHSCCQQLSPPATPRVPRRAGTSSGR